MFERSYGVEIESLAPAGITRSMLAAAIRSVGIACEAQPWNHVVQRDKWKVITDGSLTGGSHGQGVEVVSPPLVGEDGFKQLALVCGVLSEVGMSIDNSCGLHVHVDARAPTRMELPAMKRLALLYIEHESIIDTVLPPSRRGNPRFAQSLTHVNIKRLMDASDLTRMADVIKPGSMEGRYVKLNFRSFWKYGTIEFRHHSGTIDADKIAKWVIFCLRMVEIADKPATAPAGAASVENTVRAMRIAQAARAGSKHHIVYQMLMRPEGCTHLEVLRATGWKKASVAGMAHIMGLYVRKQREWEQWPSATGWGGYASKKVYRYWGIVADGPVEVKRRTGKVVLPFKKAQTVDDFCDLLGMPENERQHWRQRQALFAQLTNRS